MDLALKPEHKAFADEVREFARKNLSPATREKTTALPPATNISEGSPSMSSDPAVPRLGAGHALTMRNFCPWST